MRLMGLDVGDSRVGIALSDPLGATAQPLKTVDRDDGTVASLAELVKEFDVERIVAGLPLLMDGSEGRQAESVRMFVERLAGTVDVPVTLVDERLTTREAEAVLLEGGARRGERRGASDRVAAALILRAYMDGVPEA